MRRGQRRRTPRRRRMARWAAEIAAGAGEEVTAGARGRIPAGTELQLELELELELEGEGEILIERLVFMRNIRISTTSTVRSESLSCCITCPNPR